MGRSASRTFTVDTTAPAVTLDAANGAVAPALSTFAGSGGTAAGDDATVTVTVHAGSSTAGALVATIDAPRDGQTGAYAATAPFALANGTYTAVTTQHDDLGNAGASAARTFEIGGPPTGPPIVDPPPTGPSHAADTTPPVLSRVGLSAKRFEVGRKATARVATGRKLPSGTTVRYTLSEPATVTIAITRSGRARVLGTLTRRGAKGAGRVAFSGRIGSRALPRGRYALTLRAVDAAGNRGAAKKIAFRIG